MPFFDTKKAPETTLRDRKANENENVLLYVLEGRIGLHGRRYGI
jgi:hypothetical protein